MIETRHIVIALVSFLVTIALELLVTQMLRRRKK